MDTDFQIRLFQIMGRSSKVQKIFREVKKQASKNNAVLISGANGTYKEIVAKAIHYSGSHRDDLFIHVNLSSVPKDRAEYELFGYKKEPNETADKDGTYKINKTKTGTLFIEEISEMNQSLQEKMFQFMNNRGFSSNDILKFSNSNARVIASTSKNLKDMTAKGLFKEDLYKTFKSAHIRIPSLKERREDILHLAKSFLKENVDKFETGPKEFSKDAKEFLQKYDWPGNIRELENVVKRASILSNNPVISKKDILMSDIGSCSLKEFLEEKLKRYLKEMSKLDNCNLYDTVLSEVEKSLIIIVLQETGNNQLKAAKILGINRNTLRSKINAYKIPI